MENRSNSTSGGTVTRLSRLLRLLQLLSSGSERNSRELSEVMGISRRTIFRDLETLQEAGVHVLYDSRSRAYRLKNPLRLRLRPQTADILSVAISLASLKRLSLGRDSLASISQIEAAITDEWSSSSHDEFQNALRFVSWETATPDHSKASEHLQRLFQGFNDRTQVRLTYHADDGPQRTLFSPGKLIVGDGVIQVSGWSTFHRSRIEISISEILSIESTDEPFKDPAG